MSDARENEITGFQLDNPALESIGVSITDWREDQVELALPIVPTMLNRSGVVHGGTICTLLDAATGYAGLYSPPGKAQLHAVTLSLTSNFLSNGVGKRLTAKGMVERRGRSIYFSRAEVWLDESLLVATAVATMKYLKS
ncbi:PaaI family thioesterase [Noviherbaspirillum sp. UKPF54]|uniref:PaaI family thioesterase n=1 Tax=Noviherbaspirillum sp. UKPF54 TaxID=2601898 RepID=UPI0011B11ACA|nr:PaaI family thioesterase [Noviherbaspirillum sp. UKPF54]QDZ27122.1 PaaI family thioesterase [Noviherbaspirillum sp. UKPF54]